MDVVIGMGLSWSHPQRAAPAPTAVRELKPPGSDCREGEELEKRSWKEDLGCAEGSVEHDVGRRLTKGRHVAKDKS